MKSLQLVSSRRATAPVLIAAAAFVAAGGFVHLEEWAVTYRHVPAATAGSAVVRLGFPINAAMSLVVALALAFCAIRPGRFTAHVVAGAAFFQLGSLAALVATRRGSLFGWSEPSWTVGASRSRAVEIAALAALGAFAAVGYAQRRTERRMPPGPALPPIS